MEDFDIELSDGEEVSEETYAELSGNRAEEPRKVRDGE